jgi:moderate conductance mechanosensitive channel
MQINQTLLLNAFLVVETIKVVLRRRLRAARPGTALPADERHHGRLLVFLVRAPRLADRLHIHVPGADPGRAADPGAAQALRVLVMVTAVVIGISSSCRTNTRSGTRSPRVRGQRQGRCAVEIACLVGRYWHLIAIFYLVALLVVWLTNPQEALPFMLRATVQSLLAIAVGAFVISFISRFVNVGLRCPTTSRSACRCWKPGCRPSCRASCRSCAP